MDKPDQSQNVEGGPGEPSQENAENVQQIDLSLRKDFLTATMIEAHRAASDKLAGYPPLTEHLLEFANLVLVELTKKQSILQEVGARVLGLVEFISTVQKNDHYPPYGISFNGGDRSYEALRKVMDVFPLEIRKQMRQLPSGGAEAKDCAASKWELASFYVGSCEIWIDPAQKNPYPLIEGQTGFGSLMYSCASCREKYNTYKNQDQSGEKSGMHSPDKAKSDLNDYERASRLFGPALRRNMRTTKKIQKEPPDASNH